MASPQQPARRGFGELDSVGDASCSRLGRASRLEVHMRIERSRVAQAVALLALLGGCGGGGSKGSHAPSLVIGSAEALLDVPYFYYAKVLQRAARSIWE